jgi:hypothetical protein
MRDVFNYMLHENEIHAVVCELQGTRDVAFVFL